jgi:hypothetical protein
VAVGLSLGHVVELMEHAWTDRTLDDCMLQSMQHLIHQCAIAHTFEAHLLGCYGKESDKQRSSAGLKFQQMTT